MFWESYAYQYLVGGAVFAGGLFLVMRNGDARTDRGEDRRTLVLLVLGFLGYALVQGWFQFFLAAAR